MARRLNSAVSVKTAALTLAVLLLGSCRGEPVPRDYQNAPPAMTHPPQKKEQTPSAHGMGKVAPLPSSGAEGTAAPYQPVTPPTTATATTTVKDAPPVTGT